MTESNPIGEPSAVKTILESSYKPQADFAHNVAQLGYSYDPELSTMENKVFVNDVTGKPSIAYRGSTTAKDWAGNLKLGLGFKDPEAERRIQLADKVKAKYGDIDTIYGHSRGSLLAERAGEKTGAKVITYNKATVPTDVFKTIRPEQTDIRTSRDIVSLPSIFQTGGKKITLSTPITTTALGAHSISQLDNKPQPKSLISQFVSGAKSFFK